MKKLLLLIAIMLSIGNTFAQNADFVRTRPVGDQNVIDARLRADLSFQLPKSSSTTLNGAKDQSGYLMYNTSVNKLALYKGSSSWQLFNAENWDLSYSWGNHAGLYKPIGYIPSWSEITSKPSFASVAYSGDYNDLTNKPALNISNWNTAYSWGNHAGLYKPIGYFPSWSEITSKPSFATVAYSGDYNDLTNKPAPSTIDTTALYRKTGGKIQGVVTINNPSNEEMFTVNKLAGDRTYIKYLRLNYPKGYLLKTDVFGDVHPAISDVDYINPSALNSYVLKSYTLNTGYGLTGGGNFTASRTLAADTSSLQTISNLYPRTDSRYYKKSEIDAMISGGSGNSGTYLPTVSSSTGITYTDFKPSHWTITGNMLDVQGAVILTTETSGTPVEASIEISLPPGVSPDFSTIYDASGHGTPIEFGNVKGMHVKANNSSGKVVLTLWHQNSLTIEYRYSFKAKIQTSFE